MKLVELSLSGFKSFATKTTLRFSDGLTAVIGPNGSGKSNLAEAIRWVLGEQSLKHVRSKKSDDVIFAGSTTRSRIGVATVTLTLSNESGRLPIEASEVAITRRITRAGESDYAINGEPVRLLDVQQLLAEAGIGTKSYTVISQGTVDRYLQASPAARRELFDEATGIKALQLKLAYAERKLGQVERDAHELRTIQQELSPRLRVLKRQIARHEERQLLVGEYDQKMAVWLHYRWHALFQNVTAAQASVAASEAEVAAARSARQQVEQTLLAAATSKETSLKQRLTQELQAAESYQRLQQEQYEQRVREHALLAASITSVERELTTAEEQLTQAQHELATSGVTRHWTTLLKRCLIFLEQLEEGQALQATELTALKQAVAAALATTQHEQTLPLAQEIVGKLAVPWQAVARLSAIAQERMGRQQALAKPTLPNDEPVTKLQQQLAALPETEEVALPEELKRVRQNELTAERAGSAAAVAATAAATELARFEGEIMREKGTAFLHTLQTTPPPHEAHIPQEEELRHLDARLSSLGEIDPLALKEYEEVAARYTHLEEQLSDIDRTQQELRKLKHTLAATMHARFREQFSIIQAAFSRYFQQLFSGGTAELAIIEVAESPETTEEEAAPPVAGIEIMVHPPGKKPQHIQLLSGGEKALTSLALLLAILEVQRPPFLVLDEVDAALDEANSYRFAQLLKEKSEQTQCIVISHNRETMSQADVLYGITMQEDGVSHLYSVKLSDVATTEPALSA